jgi:hypothetical protein
MMNTQDGLRWKGSVTFMNYVFGQREAIANDLF